MARERRLLGEDVRSVAPELAGVELPKPAIATQVPLP
jgi:hypothetical protein